jgi:hypothetical protein
MLAKTAKLAWTTRQTSFSHSGPIRRFALLAGRRI